MIKRFKILNYQYLFIKKTYTNSTILLANIKKYSSYPLKQRIFLHLSGHNMM